MKKYIVALFVILLSSCTTIEQRKPNIPLQPPQETAQGYFRISPRAYYYADITSVWAETDKKYLVHFDAVINMAKGIYNFEDPELYAKSMRQSKIINCKTYQLTQLNTDYYSNFWGTGERSTAKKQRTYTIKLRPGSSLYTLSEVICVNVMK